MKTFVASALAGLTVICVFTIGQNDEPAVRVTFPESPNPGVDTDMQREKEPSDRPCLASWLAGLGLGLDDVYVSFFLPSETALNGAIMHTTSRTQVTLRLTSDGMKFRMSPGLRVDNSWPLSDVEWSGLDYSYGKATHVFLKDTQRLAASTHAQVAAEIRSWFSDLTLGTRLARRGYDPTLDPDVQSLAREIQRRVHSRPTTGETRARSWKPQDVRIGVTVSVPDGMRRETAHGGIEIRAGGHARLRASLRDDLSGLRSGVVRPRRLEIESEDIYLLKNGRPEIQMRKISVDEGYNVRLIRHRSVGGTARLGEALEASARLLGVVLLAHQQGGRDPRIAEAVLMPHLGQGAVDLRLTQDLIRRTVDDALTEEFRKLVPTGSLSLSLANFSESAEGREADALARQSSGFRVVSRDHGTPPRGL